MIYIYSVQSYVRMFITGDLHII